MKEAGLGSKALQSGRVPWCVCRGGSAARWTKGDISSRASSPRARAGFPTRAVESFPYAPLIPGLCQSAGYHCGSSEDGKVGSPSRRRVAQAAGRFRICRWDLRTSLCLATSPRWRRMMRADETWHHGQCPTSKLSVPLGSEETVSNRWACNGTRSPAAQRSSSSVTHPSFLLACPPCRFPPQRHGYRPSLALQRVLFSAPPR